MHSQEARPLQQLRSARAVGLGSGSGFGRLSRRRPLARRGLDTIGVRGLDGLVTGNRRRVPHGARHQAADAVAERGDVLTGKSWPAALGGAPSEHAEEIDHPRLLALRGARAICSAGLSIRRHSMNEGMSHAQ